MAPECSRRASSIIIPPPPSSVCPYLSTSPSSAVLLFDVGQFLKARTGIGLERVSEQLLCLPTRTGLKAVKDSASASPEQKLKGTTKRDTRLGKEYFPPFVSVHFPSLERFSVGVAVLLPQQRFFVWFPTFAPIPLPPTSSTLRVTNESPRGYGSMILLIRVEVIGNFCFDRR